MKDFFRNDDSSLRREYIPCEMMSNTVTASFYSSTGFYVIVMFVGIFFVPYFEYLNEVAVFLI